MVWSVRHATGIQEIYDLAKLVRFVNGVHLITSQECSTFIVFRLKTSRSDATLICSRQFIKKNCQKYRCCGPELRKSVIAKTQNPLFLSISTGFGNLNVHLNVTWWNSLSIHFSDSIVISNLKWRWTCGRKVNEVADCTVQNCRNKPKHRIAVFVELWIAFKSFSM